MNQCARDNCRFVDLEAGVSDNDEDKDKDKDNEDQGMSARI